MHNKTVTGRSKTLLQSFRLERQQVPLNSVVLSLKWLRFPKYLCVR